MCLTIPKKVLSVKKGLICVKTPSGQQKMSSLIKTKRGDWVLSQNDVIIQKITQKQAQEINKLIKN